MHFHLIYAQFGSCWEKIRYDYDEFHLKLSNSFILWRKMISSYELMRIKHPFSEIQCANMIFISAVTKNWLKVGRRSNLCEYCSTKLILLTENIDNYLKNQKTSKIINKYYSCESFVSLRQKSLWIIFIGMFVNEMENNENSIEFIKWRLLIFKGCSYLETAKI